MTHHRLPYNNQLTFNPNESTLVNIHTNQLRRANINPNSSEPITMNQHAINAPTKHAHLWKRNHNQFIDTNSDRCKSIQMTQHQMQLIKWYDSLWTSFTVSRNQSQPTNTFGHQSQHIKSNHN